MAKQTEKTIGETKYSVEELVKAHKRFDVPVECVKAALKCANKQEASISEAAQIISEFMNRKVK